MSRIAACNCWRNWSAAALRSVGRAVRSMASWSPWTTQVAPAGSRSAWAMVSARFSFRAARKASRNAVRAAACWSRRGPNSALRIGSISNGRVVPLHQLATLRSAAAHFSANAA